MNVYVESNFVLEHALEQEEYESCAAIVRLAARHQLKLVVPAFSLAEPHQAIFSKAKTRSRLGEDLRVQLSEFRCARRGSDRQRSILAGGLTTSSNRTYPKPEQ
jgi:hypothetical protein